MAKLTQEELRRMMPERRRAYEKRRRQVQRNRRIFASFVLLTVVLISVVILSLTVFFKIDTIKVKGDSRYDTSQIIEASGIAKGKNLFLISVSSSQESITEKLPYISKAVITRRLPSSVIIEIESTDAVFCFNTGSGYALTDADGKVLELVSEDKIPENAAVINASGAYFAETGQTIKADDEDEWTLLKTVFSAVKESGIKDITEINVVSQSNIYLVYQNRFNLKLGTTNELVYKLKSAVEIIKKEDEINPTTKGDIFLSNPGNAYVSPEDSDSDITQQGNAENPTDIS